MASLPIPRRYRTVIYIPSKNDDCLLEVCLSIPTTVSSQPHAYTGVVIAHPYGPLGGSYNNNVVGALLQWFETYSLTAMSEDLVASTSSSSLVSAKSSTKNSAGSNQQQQNTDPMEAEPATAAPSRKKGSSPQTVPLSCVICAFNFRGCGRSKGKTSWFAEAERDDYQTVVDFLQSGSYARNSHLGKTEDRDASGTNASAAWNGKVFDETGRQVDTPRLPFLSRFILSGFSFGGLIASTIPPPLRNPTDPTSGHLPTSYILVSYPAGVAWLLTSGAQGSFYKRARAILQGEFPASPSSSSNDQGVAETAAEGKKKSTVEAYFITGAQDQFTSPKTLLSWLQTNTGLNSPKQAEGARSWTLKRPDGAIHLDVVEGVDHFWLDREQELLDKLQRWWTESHPTRSSST
ncbi:hypothetical protein BC939DRAFT_473217 [Gamsiella multidivaricata]|uniref:uncharacterized protein n=1 Tax=Gamsiella multidivaricata TaxID=101098 RepID=UPI002220DF57|nr:uncharacterized protein BC939DRAFT_473217 [Gamsiella multidivaricata]KAG0355097.1 hypothetical protein BGZ54_001296 [Gamsiella multidivaricata]KAI7831152.1 hypothetical protein BC939DRAFT_473217 [Gamsiella multidivaricata]